MNWIAYSLLMFVSSVALYLAVRKSSLVKIPTELTNLAMFSIPLIVYALIGLCQHQSYAISPPHAALLLLAAVVFAYGGNTASLRAIEVAPNPGYSLVLSKSYVLFTTIIAVAFLGAELSAVRALAILIIVGCSALIMVNKSARKEPTGRWIPLSVGAFFAWGCLSLVAKYLFSHGVSTIVYLAYLYGVVTFCIVIANKITLRSLMRLSPLHRMLLAVTGLSATLFGLGQFEAIRLAPNVGYVNAINAASISLLTVLAVIIFKDELTRQKAVGILGVTLGLILLLI